jgi:hypothetical protein
LHLSLTAHASLLDRSRVAIAWAILRARHPVLAARVEPSEHNASFVQVPAHYHTVGHTDREQRYSHPSDGKAAIASADAALSYSHASKAELIATYMDGARAISDASLSHLTVSRSILGAKKGESRLAFDLLVCVSPAHRMVST